MHPMCERGNIEEGGAFILQQAAGQPCHRLRLRRVDPCPAFAAPANGQQRLRLHNADRFPQDGPRHPVLIEELSLVGQEVAVAKIAGIILRRILSATI